MFIVCKKMMIKDNFQSVVVEHLDTKKENKAVNNVCTEDKEIRSSKI